MKKEIITRVVFDKEEEALIMEAQKWTLACLRRIHTDDGGRKSKRALFGESPLINPEKGKLQVRVFGEALEYWDSNRELFLSEKQRHGAMRSLRTSIDLVSEAILLLGQK